MDYHCPPDLRPDQDLTVDALKLFQRYRLDQDVARVGTLLDEEVTRHLRLCELAIMHAAASGISWAKLPQHPLLDVDVAVARDLEKKGFVVEFRHVAREEELPNAHNEKERIKATSIESAYIAKWFLAPSLDETTTAAEWRRRRTLEDEELSRNPPQRQSTGAGKDLDSGPAIWAGILDEKFVVEVQSRLTRNFLCVFDVVTGRCLHTEETNVSYGAQFGPDVLDVDQWGRRAQEIVDAWQAGQAAD